MLRNVSDLSASLGKYQCGTARRRFCGSRFGAAATVGLSSSFVWVLSLMISRVFGDLLDFTSPYKMTSTANSSNSTTVQLTEGPSVATQEDITVHLRQPETDDSNDRKVKFAEDTVDNENLNRKKSKCCCIFEKQRLFGESSSEDEDDGDCPDHCHGRKKYHKKHPDHSEHKDENKEEK